MWVVGSCRVAFVTVPSGFDPLWWGGLGPGCSLVLLFYIFFILVCRLYVCARVCVSRLKPPLSVAFSLFLFP